MTEELTINSKIILVKYLQLHKPLKKIKVYKTKDGSLFKTIKESKEQLTKK